MKRSYVTKSIEELTTLAIIAIGFHVGIEWLTGVSIWDRAKADFLHRPVPMWTWPTWLLFSLAVLILIIETLYRFGLRRIRSFSGQR